MERRVRGAPDRVKMRVKMRKTAAVVLILAVYNLFFFPFDVPIPGRWDFLVFQLVLLTGVWLMFWSRVRGRLRQITSISSLVMLVLATMAVFEVSGVAAFLLGLASVTALGLTAYYAMLNSVQFGGLVEVAAAPFRMGMAWLRTFVLFKWGKEVTLGKIRLGDTQAKIIRGLIIALPLMFIVVGLLTQADPIFNTLVSSIVKRLVLGETVSRIAYSLLILLVLLPFSITSIRSAFVSPAASSGWKRFPVEMMTVMALLAIILGSFLIIQFRYLFASVPETELHQFGINTYSEYVRKGFIELLLVAGITYGMSALSYLVYRATRGKWLQRLNLLVIIEMALFIGSILRRVYLYEITHGLTRIRIYGSAFVVYILGLVLILGWRNASLLKRPWYILELLMGVVILIVTVAIKPDYLIATKVPPTVNNEIDYVYISQLSPDALPGWIAGYNQARQVYESVKNDPTATASAELVRRVFYASQTTTNLLSHYRDLAGKYGSDEEFLATHDEMIAENRESLFRYYRKRGWLGENPVEKQTYGQLKQALPLTELKQLQAEIDRFMEKVKLDFMSVPFDRSAQTPLL